MDYLRHCYRTRMKFWSGKEVTVPVRWFRAEPGAKVFEGPCQYRSWKTWLRGHRNVGLGEQTDVPTVYDKGANPLGFLGVNHCGPDSALYTGGVPDQDEEIHVGEDGWAECCERPYYMTGGPMVGGVAPQWSSRLHLPEGGPMVGGAAPQAGSFGQLPAGGVVVGGPALFHMRLLARGGGGATGVADQQLASVKNWADVGTSFKTGTATTTILCPSAVQNGDILVLVVDAAGTFGTKPAVGGGWTAWYSDFYMPQKCGQFFRRIANNEPFQYTINVGSAVRFAAVIWAFRAVPGNELAVGSTVNALGNIASEASGVGSLSLPKVLAATLCSNVPGQVYTPVEPWATRIFAGISPDCYAAIYGRVVPANLTVPTFQVAASTQFRSVVGKASYDPE